MNFHILFTLDHVNFWMLSTKDAYLNNVFYWAAINPIAHILIRIQNFF